MMILIESFYGSLFDLGGIHLVINAILRTWNYDVYLTQYEFGLSLISLRFGLMKSPISYHVRHELCFSTCFYKTFV